MNFTLLNYLSSAQLSERFLVCDKSTHTVHQQCAVRCLILKAKHLDKVWICVIAAYRLQREFMFKMIE